MRGKGKGVISINPLQLDDQPREVSVRSVDRALRILEVISRSEGGLSALQISDLTGLPLSTVYRLVETLMLRQFVSESPVSGKFVVGLAAFEVGAAFRGTKELTEAADPVMTELARSAKETVNLAFIDSGKAVYLHQVEAPEMLVRMFMQTGKPAPCHCSGVGKVLLAWASERNASLLRDTIEFTTYTFRTISSMDQLDHELIRVKQRGYALDDEERESGVRCVAVPIFSSSGNLAAALSVSGPSSRVTSDRVEYLFEKLEKAAAEIGERLD